MAEGHIAPGQPQGPHATGRNPTAALLLHPLLGRLLCLRLRPFLCLRADLAWSSERTGEWEGAGSGRRLGWGGWGRRGWGRWGWGRWGWGR